VVLTGSDDSRANIASPGPGVNSHNQIGDADGSAVPDKESPDQPGSVTIATFDNGQPLAINDLRGLSPDERDVVRRSDEAFSRVRQTWPNWKQVALGLVVLRELAMRETGSNSIRSKRYKDRFHDLLEGRAYAKMDATTRKDLLTCAALSPELDEWYAALDEHQRVRLNHPVNVLRAFRRAKNSKPASAQSRRARHEAELETVRQEAAAAISSKDVQIKEKDQRIEELTKQIKPALDPDCSVHKEAPGRAAAKNADDAGDADSARIVQYVIASCGAVEKIREVIDGLTAYLEQRVS
jgi:hypothetical protein